LPYVLYQWGLVLLYSGRHEPARAAAAEAVQRDPNYADAYALWAHILTYLGKPWDALPKLQQAIDRNPKDPFLYNYYRGVLEYVWGDQDPKDRAQHFLLAEQHLRAAVNRNGRFRPARAYLAAVLEARGQHNDARNEMDTLAHGGRPRPSQDLARFQAYIERSLPYADPAIRARLIDLWRRAEQ